MQTSSKSEASAALISSKPGKKKEWAQWLAIGWLTLLALGALLVNYLPLPDPDVADYGAYLAGPSTNHLLGTDELGRDILSRTLHGARVSLLLAAITVVLGLAIGTAIGLVAGYFKGLWDTAIGVGVDIILAFPVLILILVIVAIRGPSFEGLAFGMTIGTLPAFIRMSRAHTLVWAGREFVLASRGLGARAPRLIFRSVLPMILPSMLVYALIVAASIMMAEGALSFLGYGVPLPAASWGGMIASGRGVLGVAPLVVAVPSLALTCTVMALNVLGNRFERKAQS